jgi:hypothetical protein
VADVHDLCTVRLLGLPTEVHLRSSEHSDELMREFTYLRAQAADPEAADVPARLLQLVEDLRVRFSGFSARSQQQIDEAIDAGLPTVDVTYEVPRSVGQACVELGELLDEADRYCESGTYLLTLVTPPETVAYRRWFLDEFIRQAAGEAPTPWNAASA